MVGQRLAQHLTNHLSNTEAALGCLACDRAAEVRHGTARGGIVDVIGVDIGLRDEDVALRRAVREIVFCLREDIVAGLKLLLIRRCREPR